MKKFLKVIPIVALLAFIAVASQPAVPTSSAVTVPDAINLAIEVGLVALMTIGTAFLFKWTGLDLQSFAAPVGVAVSVYVIAELQGAINTIPMEYDPWLSIGFKLVVVLLGSAGTLVMLTRSRELPSIL